MDHMWLILCGALVMFMQAGFAMLEAGTCRAKNVQNILLKNVMDVCMGTIGWWTFGWMFAYGGPLNDDGKLDNGFIGTTGFGGIGFGSVDSDGNQDGGVTAGSVATTSQLNWFFQWAFCGAAATIVSGGVAERIMFGPYLLFSLVMTAFIYPIVVAWTWGYGWLAAVNDVGFMDFAGSGIVHMTGGVGALVAAAVLGPRDGRFDPARASEFDPHNLPLCVLGTFILWFGWYGFNCGSTLSMHSASTGAQAAQVAMNTTIAAATGGLVVLAIRLGMTFKMLGSPKYDLNGMCCGILAGLVSITAPCGTVECGSAFVIGIIGAFVFQGAASLLKFIGIDDPLDAFAVHGACGAWGVLAAALFDWGKGFDYAHGWSGYSCVSDDDGCISGGWGQLFVANLLEIIAIAAWVAVWTAAILVPMRVAGILRAPVDLQGLGMDTMKHSPRKAYNMEEPTKASASTADV
jgi:Amt family ammonium transporter